MFPDYKKEFIKDREAYEHARRGGFIDYKPFPIPCLSLEHDPPGLIVLPPGTYTYRCPACGKTTKFIVPEVYL